MNERTIIATKHQSKATNQSFGLINAIAEEINGKLIPITEDNFCPTRQVFIVGRYEEIESNFLPGELFRIRVDISQNPSGECKYKSLGHNAQKISPNEIAEVISAELPDRNIRRLNVHTFPSTKYILIRNNTRDCYGPFEWEKKVVSENEMEIELKIITGGGLGKIGKRQIAKTPSEKISTHIVNCDSIIGTKFFLQNISSIVAGSNLEEYSNDREIIEEIKKLAKDTAGQTINRKSLATLSIMAGKGAEPLDKSRIAIFNKIVQSNADLLGDLNEWFENYLKSETGSKILEDYIEANRSRYIDKLKSEKELSIDTQIKARQDELDKVNQIIAARSSERTRLSDDIEAKRKTLEKDILADQQVFSEKVSKEIQNKIALLKSEEEEARNKLSAIELKVGKLSNANEIQEAVIAKKAVLKDVQEQIDEKKKERDAIIEESRRAEDDIRKKLRGMKPYVDHLNGTSTGEDIKKIDIKVPCMNFSYKDEVHAQRAVIESIKTRFAGLGRCLNDQQVANLLISTQQSFITFFAGLPGVGKTSLCKLITESQNIEKRFLNVSVARGWTSIKDMVGFHNPLNDRFQPSSTGIYEFFRALDAEEKSGGINPMSYILLDEANLSSIEHYWSAFMGITDAMTNQKLTIGQDSLTIPKNLRFLATINYDGTTEPLSPRILNRAAVIIMQPGDIFLQETINTSSLQDLPISFENMNVLFGLFDQPPELESEEKSALEAISTTLSESATEKGRSIYISQRKINAIRQYCGRARSIMRSTGNETSSLDWAVKQHILPQITGHGSKFGDRLLSLRKCLDNYGLDMSKEYLDEMISYGQNNLHSYEFFCW